MSEWRCFHLDDTITAMVSMEMLGRYLVRMREPFDATRHPIEFYRGNLNEAFRAADKLIQAYYPHACDEATCGDWHKLHE